MVIEMSYKIILDSCGEHSDEPLKAKIVFSIGFHDF